MLNEMTIRKITYLFSVCFVFILSVKALYAQSERLAALDYTVRIPEQTSQSILWEELLFHPEKWYGSNEAIQMAEHILIYQRGSGGWPKNIDFKKAISASKKKVLAEYINEPLATIDNGATYTQMRFLARVYQQIRDQRYVLAFLKGLDYLLKAQYKNGGWPQYYPLRKGYYSHITYNDDAMIGAMRLLRDIAGKNPPYSFVDQKRREQARIAVEKGIDCILKTQIVVDGQLTAWCVQYDEKTLKPAKARAYELVSLSGKESVGIIWFLMENENPSPEIIDAVQSSIAWLDRVRIEGIRQIREPDPRSPTGKNKVVISDPAAPSIWARFYLIGSNKPFFSDRDGKIYEKLSDISSERRNEYGWLGYWPSEILNSYYPRWQEQWVPEKNVLLQ